MVREQLKEKGSLEGPKKGEQHGDAAGVLWTGRFCHVPVLMFHAGAIVTKAPCVRQVGERYRLSYKMLHTDSRLIRDILSAHGFHEAHANSKNFNLLWTGSHVKSYVLRNLSSFQKVNHFPRSYELTRKDRLCRNIQRMQQRHGIHKFNILPQTYLLPGEYQDFCGAFSKDRGLWIVKPVSSSRGRGIHLINLPSQISLEENTLVSRYVSNPLLIQGFKFDIRLYVLITSYEPLVIYLYEEGLTRFATAKYDRTSKNMKNEFVHLTNYSVNKKSRDYVSCDDPEVEDYGNKWSMSAMLRYLKQDGIDTATLMFQIEELIIKTIISTESSIAAACKSLVAHRGNCFELYGFDVLIDDKLKPWLLEVNLSPSLGCDAPLDLKVKASVISDMLTLIGLECLDPQQKERREGSALCEKQVLKYPRRSSATDKDTGPPGGHRARTAGHRISTTTLSEDEMKVLQRVKDEADRRGGFIRIFPRRDTWQLFGPLIESKFSLNAMLAVHLFADGHSVNGKCSSGHSAHTALYERRLEPLRVRSAPHSGTRRTGRSQEDPDVEEEKEDPAKVEEVIVEEIPDSPAVICQKIEQERPRFSLLGALKEGANLSKAQARLVFSCNLQRVRSRLQSPQVLPNEEERLELVMRFLRRAAGNLQQTLHVTPPGPSVLLSERRDLLAGKLGDFIRLYDQETQQMAVREETDSQSQEINPVDFQAFLADASEHELEDVVTFYILKNKSASVFVRTDSAVNRRGVRGQHNRLLASRPNSHGQSAGDSQLPVK